MNGRRVPRGLVLLAIATSAATAFACGSSGDGGGSGDGSAAKQMFTSSVYPSLAKTCQDCHATGKSGAPLFLGGNADVSYTAIDGFPGLISAPNVSPLVQKGLHSGPALTETQTELVTKWLDQEVTDRNLGASPGVPKNLRAAFKAFGACMDYARWKELKLHTIAATTTDNNQGACRSCHNNGMASMWASGGSDNQDDEAGNAEMFLQLRKFPYVQRLVVGRVNDQGEFDGIEGSRRMSDKGTEAQQTQANSHPRFSLSSDLQANLDTFVLETISNVAANRCPSPPDLPDAGPDADYTAP